MKLKQAVMIAVGASLALEPALALAQALEEVVVTARKREESLLKVPVVASVLSADLLERYQVQDMYAVAQRVPGFVMGESVGTVGMQTSLRGIGPTSQTATVDQSVSLNIDGLSLTQGYAYAIGMFDVGQVEVLKGPQALFYGKNSTAGVISMRSKDPTDEREFLARVGYESEAKQNIVEGIASGPVGDWAKLRLAASYSDMDGYFENTGEPLPGLGNVAPKHRDFAPRETVILRGTALLDPVDWYSARFKLNYSDDSMEGSGGDGQLVFCPDGTGGVEGIGIPFIGDADCKLDGKTQLGDFDPAFWPGVRNGGVPFMDSEQWFGTLEQDFEFTPELTLTSVTGYYDIHQDNLIRGSGSSNPTIAADFTFGTEQFSQELRLTSNFSDSPINFMVGAFYLDSDMDVRNRLRANTVFGLPPLLQSGLHTIDIESMSAFGQVLWQITDQFEIAAGARYTEEERHHRFYDYLQDGREIDLPDPDLDASDVSPELSLTWTPSDTLTLFASYRQGFKSGSFNTVISPTESTLSAFEDEEAEGVEAGVKLLAFEGSLAANAAVYYYEYTDLQVGANDLSDTGAILLRTINAASAVVQGFDADFTFSPQNAPNLTLFGAVNYNIAEFDKFPNAPCGNGQTIAEGCNRLRNPDTGLFTSQDLGDEPLVRAPEWTASVGFDYSIPLSNGMAWELGASTRYSDEYFTNLVELPEYKQDSYFKTSASVTLRGADDIWDVALIANNLEDEITAGVCSNSNTQNGTIFGGQIAGGAEKGPAGSDELGCVAERGRELWVRFTLRF
ncbi:TonB-dependent receptor [Mangrovimicrobium sediminis]|uniref:TonB-dependent receptor n=1 Tax=Mangrovimicrobium sediminis TaxID=2562682 RepID=A0A4Z0LZ68_9GAMM|nr:TonB-dependent receptor [Haliea sp. SAOS-164]TGD72510.1 TonB-dependent receptor [Haliea sp. SAOS-164]